MSALTRKFTTELGRLATDFPTESRALARRAIWRAASRFTPVMAVDRDGLRFFVSTSDRVLGRRLFVYPDVPEHDIAAAFAVLRAVGANESTLDGSAVVEVGANIGTHTVEFLRSYGAGRVIAVEPAPGNLELLRQNIRVNGVEEQVSIRPVGLSDREGVMQLELSDTNAGDHRIRVDGADRNDPEAQRETVDVPVTQFDTLVAEGAIDLAETALVWMDAQGHEGHILRGAKQLLGSSIPIVMEYWPHALRRAGGLEPIHELIADHYDQVIDLRPPGGGPAVALPASELEHRERARERSPHQPELGSTDLVLLPGVEPGWRHQI